MAQENWKMLLRKSRDLRSEGQGMLYDRVEIYSQIYRDEEFQEWCDAQGSNAVEELDSELSDTAFDFLVLLNVFDAYSKADWKKRGVKVLVAELAASRNPAARKGPSATKHLSWQEWKSRCLKAEEECEKLRAEVNSLRQALQSVTDRWVEV